MYWMIAKDLKAAHLAMTFHVGLSGEDEHLDFGFCCFRLLGKHCTDDHQGRDKQMCAHGDLDPLRQGCIVMGRCCSTSNSRAMRLLRHSIVDFPKHDQYRGHILHGILPVRLNPLTPVALRERV